MSKKAAFGVRLLITDPANGDVLRVPNVADISGPEITVPAIDVTDHDSPDGFAEFIGGLAEGGDVQFECHFDPAGAVHQRLSELVALGVVTDMSLLLPNATQAEFVANPTFVGWDGTDMPDWTFGGGNWLPSEGYVDYSSSNPGAGEAMETGLDGILLAGETYTIAITFPNADNTDFALGVTIGGVSVGSINPSNGGVQKITYTPTEDIDGTPSLALTVPEALSSNVSFAISRVSVNGPTANDTERWDFDGLVTAVGMTAPVKDALKAPVSIKVSGKPVFTTSAT